MPTAERPLRVQWVIKGLGPGGAERLLVSHATARDIDAFEYRAAYLLPWKDKLVPEMEAAGVPTTCLSTSRVEDLRWAGRLRSMLVDQPVDILHLHSPTVATLGRLVAASLPRAIRPAIVYTEHNMWSSYRPYTRLANALTYPLDRRDFAVSEQVQASMWSPWKRRAEVLVHGIPYGQVIANRALRDEARAELGVGPSTTVICTVANYRKQKAYPDLFAAARRVLDSGRDVRFVAVGQGPLEAEIEALHAELGLGDGFTLLGYRPDPHRIMAGSDIFAMSSLWEGYPVAVMEALAIGLPVVATRVGGIPSAVPEGAGILVEPSQPAALASALLELVGDDDRRRQLAAGAAEQGRRFDIAHAVARIERHYRDVAPAR